MAARRAPARITLAAGAALAVLATIGLTVLDGAPDRDPARADPGPAPTAEPNPSAAP
ncbi:hypothetical protein ACFQX7_12900 [Luedemannella flava]